MDNQPLDLSQENRRVCEKARRCIADAKDLIARLDRIEAERVKRVNISTLNPGTRAAVVPRNSAPKARSIPT